MVQNFGRFNYQEFSGLKKQISHEFKNNVILFQMNHVRSLYERAKKCYMFHLDGRKF